MSAVMFMQDIELTRFPDFSGPLWYLDSINDSKLMNTAGKIKALELEHDVKRIRAAHIVECAESEAQMKRERSTGDLCCFRLVRDLWKDGIEVAARHVLSTYRQLPYAFSAEDAIYYVSSRGMECKYVWIVAVYGGEIGALAELGGLRCDNVKMRMEESAVEVRGADNKMFRPRVAIMEVTLIDGGAVQGRPQ